VTFFLGLCVGGALSYFWTLGDRPKSFLPLPNADVLVRTGSEELIDRRVRNKHTRPIKIHLFGSSIRSRRFRSACENIKLSDPVVVVGSDGSGTRVPTKVLANLGVTILVEPAVESQMDVDGTRVDLHFTPIIQELMCLTGGRLDYELNALPLEFSRRVLEMFEPWVRYLRNEACIAANRDNLRDALGTFRWGFKKPDLMNLIPILRHFWPDLKVVHNIRDGRDMALSKNDAALTKYAAQFFGVNCLRSAHTLESLDDWAPLPVPTTPSQITYKQFLDLPKPVRMARLWATQNLGVERLRRSLASQPSNMDNRAQEKMSSVLLLRIEDLNSDSDVSVMSYAKLSEFVASPSTFCEICGIRHSIRSNFMGSHDSQSDAKHGAAMSQYGKWSRLVDDNIELLRELESHVRTSLTFLGYRPHTDPSSLYSTQSTLSDDNPERSYDLVRLCRSCV